MSDESDKLFTVELTEDEIDQCTHAINELCEVFVKGGHSLDEPSVQSYLNTARKLENVFNQPSIDTDRFAMGTPGVAHAGKSKEGDV